MPERKTLITLAIFISMMIIRVRRGGRKVVLR